MESYQPIYDAVRSRMGNIDIGAAVDSAIREANLSHYVEMAAEDWQAAAYEYKRPSVLFRPSLSIDGDQWCALYGDNLQSGVAGFGESPSAAMQDFDKNWSAKITNQYDPLQGDQ